MTSFMGSCKEISQILSSAMDRRLSIKEKLRLRLHFIVCTWCRDHRRELDTLSKGAKRLASLCEDPQCAISLSPEARQRIKDAVTSQER